MQRWAIPVGIGSAIPCRPTRHRDGYLLDDGFGLTYHDDWLNMDRPTARAAITDLVNAGRVAFTKHSGIREPARGKFPLTREQVRNCLLNGLISEGPVPDIREAGGWKVTVTSFRADERHEVAAVLIVETRVLVITGYGWEKVSRAPRRHSRQVGASEDD